MSQTTLDTPVQPPLPSEAIGSRVAAYGGGSEASGVLLLLGGVAVVGMLGIPIAAGAPTSAILFLGLLGILVCVPFVFLWARQRRCHLFIGQGGFEYVNHNGERRVTEFGQMSKLVRESGLFSHYIVYLKDGTSFRMMFLSHRALSEGWEVLKRHM